MRIIRMKVCKLRKGMGINVNTFRTYLYIQFKRALKLLPALMVVTLVSCGCVGISAALYLGSDEMHADNQKYRIAVVGDTSDSYLGFGISALSVLDDSRFMLEFPAMTESEARQALRKGEITAYAKVPEGLVESIVYGENDKIVTFVGATAQKGIAGILVEKLTEAASTLVVRSQSAIYGMQRILRNSGMGDQWQDATMSLNLRLIDMVLNRTKLCDLEILGRANGVSAAGYYFCSMLIFFLLLSGIHYSPLFGRRNRELMRLMASKGVGPFPQVAGEYLAFLILDLCCLLGVFVMLFPVFGSGVTGLAEWKGMEAGGLIVFYIRLIPVAAAFAALQFFLYESVSGMVNSILLQFIICMGMAYLAGCFYPTGMFPDALRHIGEILPAGLALRYADAGLLGEISLPAGLGLLLYLAVFLGLSVFVRNIRIQRG